MVDLELQSVARVGLPEPGDFDFFAFRYRKDHTHDRHSGGAVDLYARNRVMRVGVLIGESTDGSLQGGWFVAFFYPSVFHAAILLQRFNNRKPQVKTVVESGLGAYPSSLGPVLFLRWQSLWVEQNGGPC